jgi:hypothetical protein
MITDVDATSPLLRLVDLQDATILRAQAWTLPDQWARPGQAAAGGAGVNPWRFEAPVRSLDHALVLTGERRGQRLAAFAFGVADSDLPLRVAFPLFVHNTLQWLTGRDEVAALDVSLRAGQTIPLAAGETLWTRPQRAYEPLVGPIPPAERLTGPAVFETARNGYYLLRGTDGVDRWLAVNTADPTMSELNAALPASGGPQVPDGTPAWAGTLGNWWEGVRVWPPWVYLACLAFVLCTLEWWGFHRRRTE